MNKIKALLVAGTFGLMAALPQTAAAGSEAKIFRYESTENYCPAGLQPVSISGTICCGVPNQNMSYQQAKAHPVAKKRVQRKVVQRTVYRSRVDCPIGTKGCTFD
ncbi:hypothetical protein GGR95_001176 [Sulfitobacter undariae]|uniref:Secreted protein n=1 Tax=Sulfitobacter undariae TaxID=1563671 RepID=A0A7W6GZH6_9RHOB|nr:hypothetical protein [Sulfitobacter undariae]MBB3993545.1 hypothetical protein [Sulfitobacter undariae]